MLFISERGLASPVWPEYSENTKRIQYSVVPTSNITAEAVTVDGFVISQKTSTGIWAVNYDTENRPIDFYRIDSTGGTTVPDEHEMKGLKLASYVSKERRQYTKRKIKKRRR